MFSILSAKISRREFMKLIGFLGTGLLLSGIGISNHKVAAASSKHAQYTGSQHRRSPSGIRLHIAVRRQDGSLISTKDFSLKKTPAMTHK